MSGRIYIDVHPCGSFSSGMFWGDVQNYASTTPQGVTSYFAEAPGVDTEEVPRQLKIWRSHQKDERGDFNQWAAFCIQKWGVWFERVDAAARIKRSSRYIAPTTLIDAYLKQRISAKPDITRGVLINRARKFSRIQVEARVAAMIHSGEIIESLRVNPSNSQTVTSYRIAE